MNPYFKMTPYDQAIVRLISAHLLRAEMDHPAHAQVMQKNIDRARRELRAEMLALQAERS